MRQNNKRVKYALVRETNTNAGSLFLPYSYATIADNEKFISNSHKELQENFHNCTVEPFVSIRPSPLAIDITPKRNKLELTSIYTRCVF